MALRLAYAPEMRVGGDQHPVSRIKMLVHRQSVTGQSQCFLVGSTDDLDHGKAAEGKAYVWIKRGKGDHAAQQGFGLVEFAAVNGGDPKGGEGKNGLGLASAAARITAMPLR